MSRRDILKFGAAGLVGAATPLFLTQGEVYASNFGSWKVSLRHAHTGETFTGVYRVGDKYLPDAFDRLSYVLRDHRSQEVFPMDPHVIDILSMVQKKTGHANSTNILSGYRCPKTNNMLRSKGRGVAKNSFHMYGQALDIRMSDVGSHGVRQAALSLRAGGVGHYPRRNFVHVDTGDVRAWKS